jgi:uncharacterized membrane protein YccC
VTFPSCVNPLHLIPISNIFPVPYRRFLKIEQIQTISRKTFMERGFTTSYPERVAGMYKFIGFSLSAWAFALRIWAAMMLALYVSFWLQLENPSPAAVTVGILALSTRGQAYQKAVYRILMTVVGVVVSIAIAGLFAQARDLFVLAYAGWFGLCVYICGLLDGNRAYGVVLTGITVAFVAVMQIDSPQNIFLTGMDRGAAIVVGIAALALVNDIFLAPNLHANLAGKLRVLHQRVRLFALAILRGERTDPVKSANLLREITILHPDISALVIESSSGWARNAAARTAAVALVSEASAANALASLPAATLPSLRSALSQTLASASEQENRALRFRLEQQMEVGDADANNALFACHALDLLTEDQRAQDAIEDLLANRRPPCHVRTPIYRSHQAAARNGLRAFLAGLIAAILLSRGGWPFASYGLALTGVFLALSAIGQSPRKFAATAILAIPIAALLAGVTEFLLLDGVDQFPLLAIGMAPTVVGAALLVTLPNARISSIGFLVLVFFSLLLSPANPQDYDPRVYLYHNFLAIIAIILMFAVVWTILPASDDLRRRWYLKSARAELHDLLAGRRSRYGDGDALFRDADRIGQLAALEPTDGDERRDDIRESLNILRLAATARRIQTAFAKLSRLTHAHLLEDGYAALAENDPFRLRAAAAALAQATITEFDRDGRVAARTAAANLSWAAFLIDLFQVHPYRSVNA